MRIDLITKMIGVDLINNGSGKHLVMIAIDQKGLTYRLALPIDDARYLLSELGSVLDDFEEGQIPF